MDNLTKQQREIMEKWFAQGRFGDPVPKDYPILLKREKYISTDKGYLDDTGKYIYTFYVADSKWKSVFESYIFESLKQLENELPRKSY